MKAGVFSYKVRCFAMTGRVTIPWFQSQENGLAPTRSPAHFNRSQVGKVGLPPLARLHIESDHRSGRRACPRLFGKVGLPPRPAFVISSRPWLASGPIEICPVLYIS